MKYCDIIGCDDPASFIDDMGNHYCADCMENAINNESKDPEEFETIALIY